MKYSKRTMTGESLRHALGQVAEFVGIDDLGCVAYVSLVLGPDDVAEFPENVLEIGDLQECVEVSAQGTSFYTRVSQGQMERSMSACAKAKRMIDRRQVSSVVVASANYPYGVASRKRGWTEVWTPVHESSNWDVIEFHEVSGWGYTRFREVAKSREQVELLLHLAETGSLREHKAR